MDPQAVVIRTTDVARRFGRNEVLRGVDIEVPAGSVYGLLGRNGAGKTTLLQVLLGIRRRDAGHVDVVGMDPRAEGPAIRARVGYVPERPVYEGSMRVGRLIRFVRRFYPSWNASEEARLRDWFQLDDRARVRSLSKGSVAKLALLLALAHEPEVLVLDEPTGGLDPIVRAEFTEALIDLVAKGDRTVLFSSHELGELERVADHVGILAGGRLRTAGPLATMRESVQAVHVHFAADRVPERITNLPGLVDAHLAERTATLIVEAPNGRFTEALTERYGPLEIETASTTLEQLFRAYAKAGEGTA